MIRLLHAINQCLRLGSFDKEDIVFIDKTSLTYAHNVLEVNETDNVVHICGDERLYRYLLDSLPSLINANYINLSTEDEVIVKLIIKGGPFSSYEIHIHPSEVTPISDEIFIHNNLCFSSISYEISRHIHNVHYYTEQAFNILIMLLYDYSSEANDEQILQFIHFVYYHPKEVANLNKDEKGALAQVLAWNGLSLPDDTNGGIF